MAGFESAVHSTALRSDASGKVVTQNVDRKSKDEAARTVQGAMRGKHARTTTAQMLKEAEIQAEKQNAEVNAKLAETSKQLLRLSWR